MLPPDTHTTTLNNIYLEMHRCRPNRHLRCCRLLIVNDQKCQHYCRKQVHAIRLASDRLDRRYEIYLFSYIFSQPSPPISRAHINQQQQLEYVDPSFPQTIRTPSPRFIHYDTNSITSSTSSRVNYLQIDDKLTQVYIPIKLSM